MIARAGAVGAVLLLACVACESTDRSRSAKPAESRDGRSLDAAARLAASPSPAATVAHPAAAASSPAAAEASPTPATASGAPGKRAAAGEELPPQEPPAGTLPQPRPSEPPTHTKVALGDLAKHVGETLRFQMKDGRSLVGTLRKVDDGTVKLERDMGLGTSAFQIRLADVEQVLKRLP